MTQHTATRPALQELQPGTYWVCFDKEKIPYDPVTGKKALANDPTTWGTYEQAQAALRNHPGRYAGIGRELLQDQGIVFIDLGHCIDEQGNIAPWAQAIVDRVNSYTEKSPSDTGIHIQARSSQPLPKNLGSAPDLDSDQCIEMYDQRRYFTWTGRHVPGTPLTIEERTGVLLEFHEEIVNRRLKAKQKQRSSAPTPDRSTGTGAFGDTRYGLAALRGICNEMRSASEGGRNSRLNELAFRAGQLVGGGELTRTTAERDLSDAAASTGLDDREIEKTLHSGIESGMREPKSAPASSRNGRIKTPDVPVDTSELDTALKSQDVNALFSSVPTIARLTKAEYLPYELKIKATFGKQINLTSFASAIAEARQTIAAEAGGDVDVEYEKTDTGMVYYTRNGEPVSISNFTAEIVADITTDDGVERSRSYALEAEVFNRRKHFEVPAKDFSKCEWIDEHLGARARVTTGQSMRYHLVNAIKYCSAPPEQFHYAHTGWRLIDGTMVYLHAGGYLCQESHVETGHLTHNPPQNKTASGASSKIEKDNISQVSQVSQKKKGVSIRLTGTLANYWFPEERGDLWKAIRASLRFLDLTHDTITMPLYSSLWRSVLPEVDYGVHVASQTGWGKTELVSLVQQHFGASMHAHKLPGSWESTENSLEMLLFQAKDTVVVVDDFKPKGSKVDQDRLHMKADRVFRQLGNGSARGRLTSNLEQRAERRPRCLLISTGEDVPRGQSLKARCVVLTMNDPLTRGEAAHRLSELQQDARSGLFANAMAGFIEWLAPQIESIQSCMPDLIATEREQLRIEGHARAGTNTANMMLGIKLFLRFACESGALTAQEAQAYLTRCASALTEIAQEASRENTHDTPSEQWRRLIVAALTNKSAHLVSANGDNPGLEYGWTKSVRSIEVAGEARTEESYKGGGSQIGWIDGDDIYLLPVAAYKAARAIGNATGDDIATLEPTLRKFLAKDGLLASTDLEKARKTVTIRRRLEKIQRDVLHIKKGSLYNPLSPITSLDSGQNSGSESACEADSGVSQEAVSQDLPHSQKSEKTPPIDGVKAHYIAEDTGKEVFSL